MAQSRAELSSLIFEPVLLSTELSAAADAAAANSPTSSDADTAAKNPVNANAEADLPTQAQDPQMLEEQIRRYRDSIASLSRNSASPYSEALREQNYSLALLLAQSGDYAGAIPVLEAAMHIDRVNQGLFTPRQVNIVNQLIQNHERLGNYDRVADYEEYLYYIQTKSYPQDDPRRIAATERWADWNVESFLKTGPQDRFGSAISFSTSSTGGFGYVPVQSPSGMVYYMPRDRVPYAFAPAGMMSGSAYAMTPQMLVDERLTRAKDIYEELQGRESLSPEHKAALQRKQANIAFTLKRQMEAFSSSINRSSFGFNTLTPDPVNPVVSRGYQDNMESLEALAQTLEADPEATPQEKAQAYVDLGDWHLSFERFGRAEEAYHKAWELAGSPSDGGLSLHPVLHPDYLMPVPTFVQHPYSRELYGVDAAAPLDYKGYMDVSIEIDRRGRVTRGKILAASEGTSQVLRNALTDYLRDNRMRPFLQNGEAMEAAFDMRFYYSY